MSPENEFRKQIYDFLTESQFWSLRQLHDYQRSQLSQLVSFAYEKVPFYRDRLSPVMKDDGTINWTKWHEVPILKRQDLIDHREAMLAPDLPAGHGQYADHEGSGTTGKPVTTRHNKLTETASMAAMYRAFDWHAVDYGKTVVEWMGNDEKIGAWPEGFLRGTWGPAWEEASAAGQFRQINRATSEENVAEFLLRKEARYLTGRPRSAQAVALAAERLGFSLKLENIFTFSTGPTQEERDDCLRVFGAPMMSLYASKEVYNIAHQCSSSLNHHINSEIVLVEVIDDAGNPCPPGVRGHCIVTPFFNTAQPLIRYELGDQVTLGPPCSCGRGLPVIQSIDGRTTHLFRLPGGRKIAPSIPPHFRSLISAISWQMAQVGPLRFELRYLSDGRGGVQDFEAFTTEVRKRTDPKAEVIYKCVEVLPLTPSGKFIEYVCELPPDP
jgi:phenylacetate-CoA ligase